LPIGLTSQASAWRTPPGLQGLLKGESALPIKTLSLKSKKVELDSMPIPDVAIDSYEEWQGYEKMVELVNQMQNKELHSSPSKKSH
jgi:hypothetical protein